MLVLSRKKGERVMIGEEVIVEVVEIRGDKIRLGFTAPRWIAVNREELHEEIKKQKEQSNADPKSDEEVIGPKL